MPPLSAIQNVRLSPETLEILRDLGKRAGYSTSGTIRAIVNLWLAHYATGPTFELEDEDGYGHEIDVEAAAAALREQLDAELQDDAERRAAGADE